MYRSIDKQIKDKLLKQQPGAQHTHVVVRFFVIQLGPGHPLVSVVPEATVEHSVGEDEPAHVDDDVEEFDEQVGQYLGVDGGLDG